MQAVTDVTKRPVSFFRIVPAFIFFNDSLLPIKRFDEGKIQAVIGEVFCPLRLVPFIHPCLIVPPNKSVVQCGESGRPAVAAFDSGNLLAVATALREQHKGKVIVIAGDDDHRLENNPGRTKALEAAAAVKGVAIFPQLSAEQKERGMTDFNDLASQTPEIVASQFQAILACTARQGREGEVSGKMEKEVLRSMLSNSSRGTKGQEVYASRHAIRGNHAQSVELDRDV